MRLDLLVRAVAANAEVLAAEHGITIQVQPGEAITILGDEARLINIDATGHMSATLSEYLA